MTNRHLYISGPNVSASASFTKHGGKWKLDTVPYLRELLKGVTMKGLEVFLGKKGFRFHWVGESDGKR